MSGARRVAGVLGLAAALAMTGCTTNNFNCNVKDACRVPGAASPGNP